MLELPAAKTRVSIKSSVQAVEIPHWQKSLEARPDSAEGLGLYAAGSYPTRTSTHSELRGCHVPTVDGTKQKAAGGPVPRGER